MGLVNCEDRDKSRYFIVPKNISHDSEHVDESEPSNYYGSSSPEFGFSDDYLIWYLNMILVEKYATSWCLLKQRVVHYQWCHDQIQNCGNVYGIEKKEKNCW